MNKIFFQGVRCFFEEQTVELKPLTILVGENSTGKSTFLAIVRLIWELIHIKYEKYDRIGFNEEPFMLGSYAQIASYKGGKFGRAKEFMIGCELISKTIKEKKKKIKIIGYYIEIDAQPSLKEYIIETERYKIEIKFNHKEKKFKIIFRTPTDSYEVEQEENRFPIPLKYFLFSLPSVFMMFTPSESKKPPKKELTDISEIINSINSFLGNQPYAFAPIRTRPQRSYDPFLDVQNPEGAHIPIFLSRLMKVNPDSGKKMKEAISNFGEASGLFNNVEIRSLGKGESDPFQVNVKVSGPAFNLVDVGYGVSQILPIIVDSFRKPQGSIFLLQQPEVHLHPRAQAELGSFLAALASKQKKQFIIETHSDYLIDRIRMDIRDKKLIDSNDVSILYFERKNNGVKIHTMRIDDSGNILDAPKGYRQFFFNEEKRLLEGC